MADLIFGAACVIASTSALAWHFLGYVNGRYPK